MSWTVEAHPELKPEVDALDPAVQDELGAMVRVLRDEGPNLGRPYADTLNGSRYANMKELRFQAAGGVWRVAYAFDPKRKAILLVAGNKAGVNERRFYKSLIARADDRYGRHLRDKKRTER